MNFKIAGLVSLVAFGLQATAAPHADACGVKLTIKSSAARKAVVRTSNPSTVLLIGKAPRRLQSDLKAAGHQVDVAPTPADAARKPYAVVIVDPGTQGEAREKFANSVVLVRTSNPASDAREVENQVARKPVAVADARQVVKAREARQPIAAGPQQAEKPKVVAAAPPREVEPAVQPAPQPAPQPVPQPVPQPAPPPVAEKKVTTAPAKRVETAPAPTTVADQATTLDQELHFSLGVATSSGRAAAIMKSVRWLKANPNASVVIEGHADPVGTPEGNLELAQRRADWVRDQLIAAGIDASRLEVVSYGDTKLKYGASDGRNRRVAVIAK